MKKIICIGECALDIVFDGAQPVGSITGGRIANAAAIMARDTLPVVMASEAASDPVGDSVVAFLKDAGVDISSVDRFTDGRTPLNVYMPAADGSMTITRYENYGEADFDIVWPRVDDDSIIVYGGYYALDKRLRPRLTAFLNHCAERGAVMVYLPGFPSQRESRITRVMPAILENLEIANVVIARNQDLRLIFGVPEADRCYANHIDFYCRSMVSVDPTCHTINYYSGKEVTHAEIPADISLSLHWNAGVVAGVVASIFEQNLRPADLDAPADPVRQTILTAAARSAAKAAAALTAEWQRHIY